MSRKIKRKKKRRNRRTSIISLLTGTLLILTLCVSFWLLYRSVGVDQHFRKHAKHTASTGTNDQQKNTANTPSAKPGSTDTPSSNKTHDQEAAQIQGQHLTPGMIASLLPKIKTYTTALQEKLKKIQEANTPSKGTIYMTFDDGPSQYTEELLNILDKHKAKATFFITGNFSPYYNMIGKAFKAGHAIGVHTFTHDYAQIYAGVDAFWADINRAAELVKQQTGQPTKLLRFAGGSSNTISANYSPGIMSTLVKQVPQRGYQFFDWNVSSGDGQSITSTESVYQNVTNEVVKYDTSVVLFHDTKKTTVDAIDSILTWGKENGYVFKALTVDSPAMHHGVNN